MDLSNSVNKYIKKKSSTMRTIYFVEEQDIFDKGPLDVLHAYTHTKHSLKKNYKGSNHQVCSFESSACYILSPKPSYGLTNFFYTIFLYWDFLILRKVSFHSLQRYLRSTECLVPKTFRVHSAININYSNTTGSALRWNMFTFLIITKE